MTQANWSDDRVEQLKTLWTEGLSASQIARALGGVTRNAVIGKVHRLGLAGRASPSRSERPRLPMAPKAPSVRSHVPAAPVVEEDPLQLEDGSEFITSAAGLADRRSRRFGIPLLRSLSQGRFALLRGPCPQGLSAPTDPPRRQGQQGPDGELNAS